MKIFAFGSALAVIPIMAVAQTGAPVAVPSSLVAPIVAVALPSANAAQAALPANTEIWVAANSEVNSKKAREGTKFDMSVSRDVLLGNYVVIPRGTRAIGQISYRTGKGSFGKSGKMEFDVVDVDLGGRLIPVTGHYRVEGNGNTGATVGTAVAVGVFSAFVTGHSAKVAQGNEYRAYTSSALPVVTADATAIPATPAVVPAAVPSVSPAAPAASGVIKIDAPGRP